MLDGQKQESRLKLAGSTERLGYCKRGSSVAVTVVIVGAGGAVRMKSTPWDPWEAGDGEVAGICWMCSSRSEMRSTSMITGDVDDVPAGVSSLTDAGGFELSDSAGRSVIARDDPKKESMLG